MNQNARTSVARPASLADVAAMAGVSTGTVSRTLSRPEMISEETRQRVMLAVQKLGYVVNGAARALAMRRSHTIGAVILKFGSSNFAQVVEGLESEVAKKGYTLLLSAPVPDGKTEFAALAAMLARGVDAIALLGFEGLEQASDILSRYPGIPHAHLWGNPLGGGHCIGLDEAHNGHIALNHVADLGHREIGLVWGHVQGPLRYRSRHRMLGVKAAAKKRGVRIVDAACVHTEHGFEQGRIAAEQVLAARTGVTALLCASDYLAVGTIRGLQQNGVRVPEDISVVSFNDNDFSAYMNPPLTTVHLPIREVGMKAAHYLLSGLDEDVGEDTYVLEASLKVRDSCAAVETEKPVVRGRKKRV
ncbi:LacI family DNA-binding transcriptional regulator [Diaphorobacter caeni]|uniref:LacI family DNA-binding transcriptional regulator n=1 Tax=Diaphorobacter caeni TaxID=2784387 RepID=UPI0018902ECD|nr:LacI family DNA-binding transcriptional regulator [Diaphorobacter caeni]MBF5003164.1 LacI family DNA-binding transcriptional regulator [Diaphorobacter caeni]